MSEPDTKPKMQVVDINLVRDELREIVRSELAMREAFWLSLVRRVWNAVKRGWGTFIREVDKLDDGGDPPHKQ